MLSTAYRSPVSWNRTTRSRPWCAWLSPGSGVIASSQLKPSVVCLAGMAAAAPVVELLQRRITGIAGGGHDLLTETDRRRPACQVVSHHLDGQSGGVGGEAARWSRDLRWLLRLFGLEACPGLGGQDHGSERHSALILRILLRMRWRVDALMPPYNGAPTPRRITT